MRTVVFWLHLATGASAGLVILFMSLTGVLLAFEPQITEFAERGVRWVAPAAPGAQRLGVDAIMARARAARPDVRPSGVTLRADPTASATVHFGREGALFVDPYTGVVLGGLSRVHEALHVVVEWHRWLGSRDGVGRSITGACNLAFLGLALSGLFLWWPRTWSRPAVRAVTVFDPRLRGKPRDFNWHNVIGFWCAPVLVVLTLTGVVMSYQWANDLLYRLTGNEPPPPAAGAGGRGPDAARGARGAPERPPVSLDAAWARAERQIPGWVAITLRLPARPGGSVTALIHEPNAWHPSPRSQLTLDPLTAAVVRWEPYGGRNLGRTLRTWVRPLHTGEAGGVAGQLVAGLASAGGVMLVWTGLSLAWRRFRAWTARTGRVVAGGTPVTIPEISGGAGTAHGLNGEASPGRPGLPGSAPS